MGGGMNEIFWMKRVQAMFPTFALCTPPILFFIMTIYQYMT